MTTKHHLLGVAALLGGLGAAPACLAGAQPFLGEIFCGGWNFAPVGTMPLDGALLPISGNEPLFSLIGTTFGGDGQFTFQLPDLRGRAIADSSGSDLGEAGGSESVTLNRSQLPVHSHGYAPPASGGDATLLTPAGAVAATKARTPLYAPGPGDVSMLAVQSGSSGSGQPIQRRQPYLAVTCVIATQGIYPSRN